MLINQQHYML